MALLRTGFAEPPLLPVARWALTPPFHPYPTATNRRGRFAFCCTFLEVSLTGRYPASCPAEPGLSSRPSRASEYLPCCDVIVLARGGTQPQGLVVQRDPMIFGDCFRVVDGRFRILGEVLYCGPVVSIATPYPHDDA